MNPYSILSMVKGTGGGSGGGGAAVVNPLVMEDSQFLFGAGLSQATASISLNSDGTATPGTSGSPAYWYDPITSGIGSSYWALITITSGTLTSGTTGSRVSLASGATWSVTTTGTGAVRSKSVTGTVEIWNAAAAGTKVADGTFTLDAEVDNT